MKKLLFVLSIVLISFISTHAQPYIVTFKVLIPTDCTGGSLIPLYSEAGAEGKEFLIPDFTLPPEYSQYQEYYNVFAGGIVGLDQGTLNENVTIEVNLEPFQCSPPNPNLLELVRMSVKVIGEKTGSHDAFTYYQFNTGKKAFIKLKADKVNALLQKEGVTIDELVAWFYGEGFTPDITGISYSSDSEWCYIYLSHLSKIILGVIKGTTDIQNSTNIPSQYKLGQNYPNPFNPETKINFALPKEGYTKITVYNSIGVKVKTLISEAKPAGTYSITFNAGNLPSGIYFYDLTSGNFKNTKKMILIK